MNSIDRELLEQARRLIEQVDLTPTNSHWSERQTPQWRAQAAGWLTAAAQVGVLPARSPVPAGQGSNTGIAIWPGATNTIPEQRIVDDPRRTDDPRRWRPISTAGDIANAPAPENPDESDEGETGPAEQQL